MRALRLATCLWPGLPQLWIAGSYSGLALAIGFALLVDLVLVSTLAWTELLSETLAIAAWGGVIAFWLVSAWISLRWLLQGPATAKNADEDLFREAQANYLQANWFDVEVTLGRLLERQPRDVEARLLLTTLYRHTGRFDEAEAQLRVLEKLDGAVKWQMEIRQERALVADAREEPSEKTGDQLPWSNVVPFASAA
jgi:hypothetical protein